MTVLSPEEYDQSYFDGSTARDKHNAGYDKYERWYRKNSETSLGEFWKDYAHALFKEHKLRGKKVLEIGCAKGFVVEDLRELGIDAYGLDVSEYAISQASEKIRPYLREYPFHTDRIGISISFRTNTDGHPLDGSVAHVSIGKSKIFYYTAEMRMSDPINSISLDKNNKPITKIIPGELEEELVPLMEESYEEALKIVGILPSPNQKD